MTNNQERQHEADELWYNDRQMFGWTETEPVGGKIVIQGRFYEYLAWCVTDAHSDKIHETSRKLLAYYSKLWDTLNALEFGDADDMNKLAEELDTELTQRFDREGINLTIR
jgi:hypothetical protein